VLAYVIHPEKISKGKIGELVWNIKAKPGKWKRFPAKYNHYAALQK